MTPEEAKALATEVAQQVAQGVGQQTAAQLAQQIAEQVGQAVSQAISKLLQSQAQTTGGSGIFTRQEMADIGGAETHERALAGEQGILFANKKRTYDEYQNADLETIKRNQRVVEQAQNALQTNLSQINNISLQLMQHAVENANILGKKVAENVGKCGDIATDRMWNVDEQGYTVDTIIKTLQPTLETVVAKILADMAKSQTETTKKTA